MILSHSSVSFLCRLLTRRDQTANQRFRNADQCLRAVGMFGKYLNNVPDWTVPPAGVDAWMANGGGDYIAPRFGVKNLAFYGIPDGNKAFSVDDYTTSVVG